MPERLNLPRLATVALCAVIGLQAAWIVAGQLGSRDPSGTEAGAAGDDLRRSSTAAADAGQAAVARVAAARLFGDAAPAVAGVGPAPPTSLGLVLVGVFAREDPEGGRAIIGESAAAARLHAVGATLPGGARLLEVYGDRVILGVGGARETLFMPRVATPGLATEAPAIPPPAGPAPAPGAMPDPNQLVRWQAILREGRIAGVRVYPGERAELFRRAGLQPGDLVVEINGTPVASEAGAAQFAQTLAASPSSTLRVERGGQLQELRVDVARLMAPGAE
jgi:general secretion pathway protein C